MRGLDRRLSIYLLSLISDLVSRLGAAARSSCPLFRVSLGSLASDMCILLGFIHIQMIWPLVAQVHVRRTYATDGRRRRVLRV